MAGCLLTRATAPTPTSFRCADGIDPDLCPANKKEIVDQSSCTVTTKEGQLHARSKNWCEGATPNQQLEEQLTKNYLSFPSPINYM
jgi:hypothetical protein